MYNKTDPHNFDNFPRYNNTNITFYHDKYLFDAGRKIFSYQSMY